MQYHINTLFACHFPVRLLTGLLSQPGVGREDVLCCVDGATSVETLRLLKVFNITTLIHQPEGTKVNANIAR